MKPFSYIRALDVESVFTYAGADARLIAGGTNLLDLMKLEVETPKSLLDISRLRLGKIEDHDGGLRIGALVSNSDCAADQTVRGR